MSAHGPAGTHTKTNESARSNCSCRSLRNKSLMTRYQVSRLRHVFPSWWLKWRIGLGDTTERDLSPHWTAEIRSNPIEMSASTSCPPPPSTKSTAQFAPHLPLIRHKMLSADPAEASDYQPPTAPDTCSRPLLASTRHLSSRLFIGI